MAVQITHVRFEGFHKTEAAIVEYRWIEPSTGATGDNDKPSMVKFIDVEKGKVVVGTGASEVAVGVVHPNEGLAFLRTYADDKWTNNLISLPTF